MTDMRRGRLMQSANGDHSDWTLRVRVAHCPPPPVARTLSNPSWKVIVSASRGQYLRPGSFEPGFFLRRRAFFAATQRHALCRHSDVDRLGVANHHCQMIANMCIAAPSKKAPLAGTGDRRAR